MTSSPPDGPFAGRGGADPPDPGPTAAPVDVETAPPVVAILVTHDPGPLLESALASLEAQDYPALSILVVDAGSELDPSARVAAVAPTAFVQRIGGSPGLGGAVNEALTIVEGPTFVLVCHDDVILAENAVRVMVEEAYRSNAAIVGAKLVSVDDYDVLLEVGRSVDRFGRSHTGIEPGEIDQEQHDAVRDVFAVSSAAMLVRADLLGELGGFDPEAFPGSEDLDLCWRARLAGARVMVAPDARVAHQQASSDRDAADRPPERELARRRVRTVLTCYGFATLLWVVPVGIVLSFVESITSVFSERRAEAFAGWRAWWWNLLHWRRLRGARKVAQRLRRVHDRDLHELQSGVGASLRTFADHHRADERAEEVEARAREIFEATIEWLRHPAAVVVLSLMALVLLGSRELITEGVPSIGTLQRWPGVEALFAELSSSWRHTGLGSTAWSPPALGMMAALGGVLLGNVGFAQTLLVVCAFGVGSLGAFRVARSMAASHGAAAVAAIAYGISAVPRNAVANGRLGPLVLFALAPFVVLLVVRVGRFENTAGLSRRPVLGLAIATALAGAWYPPALVLAPLVALVLLVVTPLTGELVAALRALGWAVLAGIGGAVLLGPWTATLVDARSDRSAWGLVLPPDLDLGQVLRFQTGPNGAGVAGLGLLALALAALFVARGPRARWATRGWALAVAGYAAAWLPGRLAPDTLVPAPEAGLVLAALGLAIAGAATVGGLVEAWERSRIGWRQAVGALALVGLGLGGLGFLGDVLDGRWHAASGWADTLEFTRHRSDAGEFRILWIGDPSVLPGEPVPLASGGGYVLTRNGPGDARELWRAPVTAADAVLERALDVARRDETNRLGRMLAPAGVRYVAVPARDGPGGRAVAVPNGLQRTLDDQLDLARLGAPRGLVLYENQSWAPIRAVVDEELVDGEPLRASVSTDLSTARPVAGGPVPAGTVLLGEAYDDGWSVTAGDTELGHTAAFDWTNAWSSGSRASISLSHDGQGVRWLVLGAQLAVWVVVLVWWSRGRRRAHVLLQSRAARREEDERFARSSLFDEVDEDDDDFWEQL